MIKPDQCRAAIVAAIPAFAREPQRLRIWVDQGRLVSRRSAALGFEWRYRLRIFVTDHDGSPDTIMVPLLLWMRDAQPELLLDFAKGDGIRFEADILDSKRWDVLIELDLSEAVTVIPREGGGWDVTHIAEPSPDDPLLAGAVADVPLRDLWVGDAHLLPKDGA